MLSTFNTGTRHDWHYPFGRIVEIQLNCYSDLLFVILDLYTTEMILLVDIQSHIESF